MKKASGASAHCEITCCRNVPGASRIVPAIHARVRRRSSAPMTAATTAVPNEAAINAGAMVSSAPA